MSAVVRDAASLMVLSPTPPHRVLMGQRPQSARFMPGVYVFPGGAVEPGDDEVSVVAGFAPRDSERMRVLDETLARALGVAAVRETFEETGVLCACPGAKRWDEVAAGRAAVDLSRLRYLGRALTPPVSRIRFHARFFYVFATSDHDTPSPSDELGDPRWVDPADPGSLPIARVTRFMLQELERRLRAQGPPEATPFYHRDDGVYRIEFD